jgi:SAM-dependent methyltransferase
MAAWLAEKVGTTGQVVATDIDLGYLRQLDLPNLEVVEHNILEDPLEPLGPGTFDLVCSRLTLFHLVDTQELAIQQMVKCLRPGGWLIDEDADWGTAAPVDPSHPLYAGYHDAWRDGDWWTVRGYDKVLAASCQHYSSAAVSRTYVMSCHGGRTWRITVGKMVGGDAGSHQ